MKTLLECLIFKLNPSNECAHSNNENNKDIIKTTSNRNKEDFIMKPNKFK